MADLHKREKQGRKEKKKERNQVESREKGVKGEYKGEGKAFTSTEKQKKHGA